MNASSTIAETPRSTMTAVDDVGTATATAAATVSALAAVSAGSGAPAVTTGSAGMTTAVEASASAESAVVTGRGADVREGRTEPIRRDGSSGRGGRWVVARLVAVARHLRPPNPLADPSRVDHSRVEPQPSDESAAARGVRMRRRNDPNP